MFILDSLLISGIKFALDKVREVAEQELDNPEMLHQQLLEAQMQLEEGAIDEATFAEIEARRVRAHPRAEGDRTGRRHRRRVPLRGRRNRSG